MDSILTYLLIQNQYLLRIISELLLFISKYIPLKQMAFEDSNSPQYQKFKVDRLPNIVHFEKVDYLLLPEYYKLKYKKVLKPINCRNGKTIPEYISCPRCDAPHQYIYDTNGSKGQFQCKVCFQVFNEVNHATKPVVLLCSYYNRTLEVKKDHKHFRIHKCTNKRCSYYLGNLKKLTKNLPLEDKFSYKIQFQEI
ncbi:MAG: hypothetical protein AB9856_14980 [Cellulosilyticaceae bacterium]